MRSFISMRYFIGFLVTIGLIIILIVLLLSGGGGGNNKNNNTQSQNRQIQTPTSTQQLADFASSGAVVRLTIDGQINADQDHQAVRITVGQDETTYQQVQGYQGNVVNQQSFANNQSAYSNFLYALGHAGFTMGDTAKDAANEKGYCPLGERYTYELIDGGDTIMRWWSASCGNVPKTYKGNPSLTITLFQNQVPGYDSLTNDLSL